MKKIFFTLFILQLISRMAFSQILDPTFGTGGVASLASLGFYIDERNADKVLQADGKILLAGTKNNDFAVARLNTDGSLDASFGIGGIVTIDLAGKTDNCQGIAVQSDGKIVMVGYQYDYYSTNCRTVYYNCNCSSWGGCQTCSYNTCDYYYGYDYGIIRLNPDGSLDNSFGNSGKEIISHIGYTLSGTGAQEILKAVAVQGDGKIVATGYENNQMILFRFNTNGSLDNSFNNGYQLYNVPNTNPNSLIIKSDGKILINAGPSNPSYVYQINENSSIDGTFGSSGIISIPNTSVQDMKINSLGKILVAGFRYSSSPQSFMWIVQQYTTTGTLDNNFGSAGETIIDFNNAYNNYQEEQAYSLSIDPLDNLYVGGYVYYQNTTVYDLAVAKLNSNGILDAGFGNGGKYNDGRNSPDYFGTLLLQPDNNILSISNSQNSIIRISAVETSIACPGNKTVETFTTSCDAVVNDIDPIVSPAGAIVNYKIEKGGVEVASGTGSVSGKTFSKGVTTVTYTLATDVAKTCSFTITVEDKQKPIVITKNITVQLDASGAATITPAQVNNGSTDNCTNAADLQLILDKLSFDCSNIGLNTVMLTVTDATGNSASGTATVTVQDKILPTVNTQNITVQLDANGAASIMPAQINNGSTDNCSIPVTGYSLDKLTFNCTNVGANTVILTVTDVNGNFDTKTAVVTVADNIKPTVITQPVTIYLDASGTASLTAAQVNNSSTDNCSIPLTGYSLDKSTFDCTNVGPNTVTLTVTDVNENFDTKTAVVTVVDNIKPTVITQPVMIYLDASGVASLTAAQVNNGSTDNCTIASYSLDKTDFNCSNVGPNTVTLTVTDVNGNFDTKTAVVTVLDNIKPTIITQPVTIYLDASGSASLTAAQINNVSTDNCSIPLTGYSLDKSTFNCTNVGANTVTLTVTDVNGNFDTKTAIVTVVDNVKPTVITQPVTIYLDPTGSASVTAAEVNNVSTDNCTIATYSLDKTRFNCSNVGPNTVTLTVTDVNGNFDTKTAVVTVADNIKPTVITQPVKIYLDATGSASVTAAQVNNVSIDNCSIATYSLDKTSFNCSNVGPNTVTLTVTDVNGNSDKKTAVVTVVDNIKPTVFTQPVTIYLDPTGSASVTAAEINNVSTDNCTIATYSLDKTSFSCSDVGPNTVTLTVTDVNGNFASGTATVNVEDKVKPTVITQPVTIYLDAAGSASVTAAQVNNVSTDNCSIASYSLDKTSFNCSDVGPNTVTLTVTDVNGNFASGTATITVEDKVKPTVITQPVTIYLDASGSASVTAAQVNNASTDNCNIASYSLDKTSFSCSNVGPNTVTLTVTDVNANFGTKTAVVTVVDNIKPTVVTQNIIVQLNASGSVSILPTQINNVSTDNCSIAGYSLNKTTFNCSNVGANPVILTVTDVNGNSQTGNAIVTVQDNIPPVASCKSISVYLGQNGMVTITAQQVDNGSSDACGVTLSLSKTAFNTTNVGANTVTLTVSDPNGNSSICSTTVTVMKRPVTLTYAGDGTEQYSDQQLLTAVLKDQLTGSVLSGKTIGFVLGSQSASGLTGASGIASTYLILTQDPAALYTVSSNFAGDATYLPASDSDPFDITQEDARADYTGVLFASTSSASSNTATVLLAASIRDISVTTDASGDTYSGDIRKALVRFINRDNNTPISGWLPVSLVSATDLTTGTVAYSWQNVSIGNLDAALFTVGIEVGGAGYYVRNSSTENAVITIAKPLGDFVSGGGYNKPSASAGTYKSDLNARMNFGLNVKYNKTNKNVQGNINFIFRRTIAGVIHTYQIKGNAMTSLSTNTTNPLAKTAVFTGKANLTDITNPLLTVSIGGGYLLQVTMTDRGEPGTNDAIGVTLYDNSTLLYSNNWISGKTAELTLIGGNLNITNSSAAAAKVTTIEQPVTLQSKAVVSPNPANQYLNLQLTDEFKNRNVDLQLFDNSGSLVKHWLDHFVGKGQLIKLSVAELTNGLYTLVVKDNKGKLLTFKIVVQH